MPDVAETHRRSRRAASGVMWWPGWGPLAVLPAAVLLGVPATWPRWAFMWTLAMAIFCGCKWLTWRWTPTRGVPLWKHLGYLLAWPGMDARAFMTGGPLAASRRPTASAWLLVSGELAAGLWVLFWCARRVPVEYPYLVGWVGMVGIVLVLHFGVFGLISCGWRAAGVDARPLMSRPFAAVSVTEFWGQRWNAAFRDLTYRFLFRPLTPRIGARRALLGGFVFSGLVHDVVISVPAGGGFGGPTLFFLFHGAAVFFERSGAGRGLGLGTRWRGRLFTMGVLIAPAPLLFHPPFVTRVVVPFMRAVEAI